MTLICCGPAINEPQRTATLGVRVSLGRRCHDSMNSNLPLACEWPLARTSHAFYAIVQGLTAHSTTEYPTTFRQRSRLVRSSELTFTVERSVAGLKSLTRVTPCRLTNSFLCGAFLVSDPTNR